MISISVDPLIKSVVIVKCVTFFIYSNNISIEEREKERERGSNLRWQRLASPTAQVLVAQTTQPVQKNRLRDEL